MTDPKATERFVQHLLSAQPRVRAFVRCLVPDANQVDDILQEVNLVLWRKADQFTEGTDFSAWACKTAHFQVLAHRQKFRRDRHLFDDELVRDLATEAEKQTAALEEKRRLLRTCIEQLTESQRDLLERRYGSGRPLTEIAQELARPAGSIHQTLFRIRTVLIDCVRRHQGATA